MRILGKMIITPRIFEFHSSAENNPPPTFARVSPFIPPFTAINDGSPTDRHGEAFSNFLNPFFHLRIFEHHLSVPNT
jgi:hypothetical protein